MNLENRWVFGFLALLGVGVWLAFGGVSTIASQLALSVVAKSNVKALESVELEPNRELIKRLDIRGKRSQRNQSINHSQLISGVGLPTGFTRVVKGRSLLEDMYLDLQVTLGEQSGFDICVLAYEDKVIRQFEDIETRARQLAGYASESQVEDFVQKKMEDIDTSPFIMIANAPAPPGVTEKQFSEIQNIVRKEMGAIVSSQKQDTLQKVGTALKEWAEIDGLDVGVDFSKPTILSESQDHITFLMNIEMDMAFGSDSHGVAMTVIATTLNIDGRIVYLYGYVEQGSRAQLQNMAEWVDSIIEKI